MALQNYILILSCFLAVRKRWFPPVAKLAYYQGRMNIMWYLLRSVTCIFSCCKWVLLYHQSTRELSTLLILWPGIWYPHRVNSSIFFQGSSCIRLQLILSVELAYCMPIKCTYCLHFNLHFNIEVSVSKSRYNNPGGWYNQPMSHHAYHTWSLSDGWKKA